MTLWNKEKIKEIKTQRVWIFLNTQQASHEQANAALTFRGIPYMGLTLILYMKVTGHW